mgnify:CR=1 FL=1
MYFCIFCRISVIFSSKFETFRPGGVPLRPPGVPPSPSRVSRREFWSILVAPGTHFGGLLALISGIFSILFRVRSRGVFLEPLWRTFRLKWSFLSTILAPIAKKVKFVKTVKTLSKTYVFEGWRRSFWRLFGICLLQFSLTRFQTILTSILSAFWVHFRLMLAPFSRPFSSMYFYTNFGAFQGGTPPGKGRRRQGRSDLWERRGVTFGGPDGDITVCLCTFCTSACEEAQG